jgi:hypothetical protein
MVVDPNPPDRDLLAATPTATFSFTVDAGGVTPITIVENVDEPSGFANIEGAKLELNLDAYTGTTPLILIDAKPGNVSGRFNPVVTFLGSRTATVNYDEVATTGNVRLINFQGAASARSPAGAEVPEPSGLLIMTLTLGLLLFSFSAGAKRQTAHLWGYQCLKVRA